MGGDYNAAQPQPGLRRSMTTPPLRAYMKNALNEAIVLGKRTTGFYVGAPRTVGVNVDYRF